MHIIQDPLVLPPPWCEAAPGSIVSVRTSPGCFTKTTVARPVQFVDGVPHLKPCGFPWTPLHDCVLGGLPQDHDASEAETHPAEPEAATV